MTNDNKPGQIWFTARERMTPERWRVVADTCACEPHHSFALSPFVAYHDGEQWWMAAAVPPMPFIEAELEHWTPECIGEVVLIDPRSGQTKLLGDAGKGGYLLEPGHSSMPPERETVRFYTNGVTYARHWVAARRNWIDDQMKFDALARTDHEVAGYTQPYKRLIPLHEPLDNLMPGLLVVGQFAGITSWAAARDCEQLVVDDPRMVRAVADALLRSARLPKVTAEKLKSVA